MIAKKERKGKIVRYVLLKSALKMNSISETCTLFSFENTDKKLTQKNTFPMSWIIPWNKLFSLKNILKTIEHVDAHFRIISLSLFHLNLRDFSNKITELLKEKIESACLVETTNKNALFKVCWRYPLVSKGACRQWTVFPFKHFGQRSSQDQFNSCNWSVVIVPWSRPRKMSEGFFGNEER